MENTDDDVLKKIIRHADDADEASLRALAQTSRRHRRLVDNVRQKVLIVVTSKMVQNNKDALTQLRAPGAEGGRVPEWHRRRFVYPELADQVRRWLPAQTPSLASVSDTVPAPRKLTILLHPDDLTVMPELPLALTRDMRVVKLLWLRPRLDRSEAEYIPTALFDRIAYPRLRKVRAASFRCERGVTKTFAPTIEIIECLYQMETRSLFSHDLNPGRMFPNLRQLRTLVKKHAIYIDSPFVHGIPDGVPTLWIGSRKEQMLWLGLDQGNLSMFIQGISDADLPRPPIALEHLVFVNIIFDYGALFKSLGFVDHARLVNLKTVTLHRCSFSDRKGYDLLREIFPPGVVFHTKQ